MKCNAPDGFLCQWMMGDNEKSVPRPCLGHNNLREMTGAPGRIEILTDPIAEKLDEMSDIAECWRKNREKQRMPTAIRSAMVMLAEEISMLVKFYIKELPTKGIDSAVDRVVIPEYTAGDGATILMDGKPLTDDDLLILLNTNERLLAERQKVLDAIPECEAHGGNCVPHAIEWIKAQRNN